MAIAIKVKRFTGMRNMIQHRTAVNISSNALAKVLRMELSDLKNNAVTMPMPALLKIIAITLNWNIDDKLAVVKAVCSEPVYCRARMLQMTESMYMNTFWTMKGTSPPLPFKRYSLYTPAKQEQKTCTRINMRLKSILRAKPEPFRLGTLSCLMMHPSVNKSRDTHWMRLNFLSNRI